MRELVRVSELSLWQKCRRRTFLSYELGWDSQTREQGIGSMFHANLAEYYSGQPRDEEEIFTFADAEDLLTVEAMFHTYDSEVQERGLDNGIITMDVEVRLEAPILPGLTLTGQIDHVYRDEFIGTVVIQDTKTVGAFFETAQRDFQLMCYAYLARYNGYEVGAIEHNIVKRNRRTARAKPPFIQRNRHYVSGQEIARFGRQLIHLGAEYQSAMKAANGDATASILWPKGTNECSWSCPFASICGMLDDAEADWLGALEAEYVQKEAAPL